VLLIDAAPASRSEVYWRRQECCSEASSIDGRVGLKSKDSAAERRPLLTIGNVDFETIAWAPNQADVDLSIACMFEREMPGVQLAGGLLHLDEVLGGALTRLRHEGHFRAQEMETLLVRKPPIGVSGRSVLIIGLGSPITFASAILERATRVAVREATRLGACTVAFAPNLLDAGRTDADSMNVEAAIAQGTVSGLQAEYRLSELGLANPPAILSWAFDVGPAHIEAATASFLRAFSLIVAP
jgi:hypothetical protein